MNDAIDFRRDVFPRLPAQKLEDLRRLAVPRFVTRDLLGVLQCRTDIDKVPFLRRATWDVTGNTFVLDADVRTALLETWIDAASPTEIPEALSDLNAAIARHLDESNEGRDALYHRLGVADERDDAATELEQQFDELLDAPAPDIGRAHDLLRLLDEWRLFDKPERVRAREQLRSRLARRSLWAREREATEHHLARQFDNDAWQALKQGPQWILNIHAPGGSGKTTYVRNLLGRVAPGEELAAARVDFDYVAHLVTASNQPWRLLLLIARQLSQQIPGDPFSALLSSWGELAVPLLPRPRAVGEPQHADGEETRAASEVPKLFRSILSEYKGLSVVVLDTLENLFHTEAATLCGIIKELVEIHRDCSQLRVILSSRFDIAAPRWGNDRTEETEWVAGFITHLVGPPENQRVRGPLRFGSQVITLAIPPFSGADAVDYLTARRGFAEPGDERVVAAVEKCGGNPLKLAMLADVLTGDNPPTADEIRALESTELFYLADRVLDRITDPRVQWLLRWGVIPRVLTRDFAERVLWPRLVEHFGGRSWDRPEDDALGKTGRGVERYVLEPNKLAFDPAWRQLVSYAACSSWVAPVAELPDTLAFHPETRDPIRGLLRRHRQAIYHELNRAAVVYWRDLAATSHGIVRENALRSVLFHAFEPYSDRPAEPAEVWSALIDEAGDDAGLRAALAREVLDIEARAQRKDREQELIVLPALVEAAHGELARDALAQILSGAQLLPELRRHLDRSSMKPAMRSALLARGLLAVGNVEAALPLLDEATAPSGIADLDDETRLWATVELARARGDIEALERAQRDTAGSPGWPSIAAALAEIYMQRGDFPRALFVYERLGDAIGITRCEIALADFDYVHARLADETCDEAIALRGEALLARLDPDAVLKEIRHLESKFATLAARAHVLLGESDVAMSILESLLHRRDRSDVDTWLVAARTCLDVDRPGLARRFLLEPLRAVDPQRTRATLLDIEAMARLGEIEAARSRLAALRLEAGTPDPAPLDIRISALIARWQVDGFRPGDGVRLRDLLRHAWSPRHRLSLLVGLASVPAAPGSVVSSVVDDIEQLTRVLPDAPARLVLARVDLLRVLGASRAAGDLLRTLAASASPVVRRYTAAAASRAEQDLSSQAETTREAFSMPAFATSLDAAASPLPDTPAPAVGIAPPRSRIWSLESTLGCPYPDDATYLLPKLWKEESDVLGDALASRAQRNQPLVLARGEEPYAWIPWQLATVRGVGIVAALGVDHLRRTDAARSGGRAHRVCGASIISKGDGRTEEYVRQVKLRWSRFDPRVVTGVEWQEWAALFVPATVIYIVAHLEQRKNGSVVLDLCGSAEGSTSARQLGRALKSVEQPPPLIVLDVPWPGGDATATKQFLLRERFAWELHREAPDTTVLCVGFRNEELHDAASTIVEGIAGGRSLASIVGDLQRSGDKVDSYAQHLARRGTTLYANGPDTVIVEQRSSPPAEVQLTRGPVPDPGARDLPLAEPVMHAVATRGAGKMRALLIGCQVKPLKGVYGDVAALAELLGSRGFLIDQRIEGEATRAGILDAYDELIDKTQADDAAVIYYSGHGGYAVNSLARSGERRGFRCLVPTDWGGGGEFRGILDVELSDRLAKLTARTRNVTAIFDCCYAAEMSRVLVDDRLVARSISPAWAEGVPEFLSRHRIDVSCVNIERNPHAIQLAAAEADRTAFECCMTIGEHQMTRGIFTYALENAIKEAGELQLSWQTIGSRIRELVLQHARAQRPRLEGPADRLLFTTRIAKRTDAVVYFEDNGVPALRAGRILGANVGAVYDIVPLGEREYSRSAIVTRATVIRLVGSNAHVELDGPTPPVGSLAYPNKLPYPPIAVHAQDSALRELLEGSAQVELVDDLAIARFHVTNDAGQLCLFEGRQLAATATPDDDDGRALLVKRLERWSKAEALRALSTTEIPRNAVAVSWGRVDPRPEGGKAIEHAVNARLHVGESVYVTVTNRSDQTLYLGIFDVGVGGKVSLLTAGCPHGRVLEPGSSFTLGARKGVLSGLGPLWWPDDVPADSERRESVIVISANHPTDFMLLETPALPTRSAAFNPLEAALDSFRTASTRDAATQDAEDALAFHIHRIDFDLSPARRTAFAIDQSLGIRALDHALTALPPDPESSRRARIAVRLDEVTILTNRTAWSGAMIRIDMLALTAAGDSGFRARTELFPLADGGRGPLRNLLLYEGLADRFLDLSIWISHDGEHTQSLKTLIEEAENDSELQGALATVRGLAAGSPQAAPVLGVAASVATVVTSASRALEAAIGNTIGLYRTSFLPREGFGLGRHPAQGTLRTQDFSFVYTVYSV
jgi:hypothetical protein